ncbi:MAG: peptidase [Anaerosolibacter sp.]|jgi:Zn-dependent protease|uniref:site-2 protease family protein n=1 Tax=Anaerosolibacter sp. TaxID=1872527 RepID=UPI0026103F31|nr:site-2 protease family protein [Anaerosolibacter sp.]MDF2548117.1 peptidase [Anaerosolibacter sp.]
MNFDIRDILLTIPGILIGFSFHEYAHAQAAVWLGDDTPKHQGRLTLSPMAHIDPIGFLMIVIARFGWAKPVEVNPYNFKNRRRDDILVSLAGPMMNLFLAFFFLLLMKAFTFAPPSLISDNLFNTIMEVFDNTVWMNIVLFVFNLLPIPPLDGSHILFGLLNLKEHPIYDQLYSAGRIILMMMIISRTTGNIIGPPIGMIYGQLAGLFF